MRSVLAGLAVAASATCASAAVYNDATGETHDGNANMDIKSVEVTNTLSDITFKVTLNGSIAFPNDWGKYVMGIDSVAGGDSAGNPWARNISMPGMDFWVASWADGGGGGVQLWQHTGSWSTIATPSFALGTDTVTWTIPLSSLNLTSGGVINFDVYTTGSNGGDGANDASSLATQASSGWSAPYNSGSNVTSYNVVVPEPAGLAMLAGVGLLGLVRRRK